jgi:hypothetical protein
LPCSSNCRTKNHETWGECVRSKGLQIADVGAHLFNQSRSNEINQYVKAREAGLQPESVFKKDVDAAWKTTEATGTPYRADV